MRWESRLGEPPRPTIMKIHLVTYATPRFRLRQLVLGWSARLNRVADTVTHWTPEKLLSAGFEARCKDIKLTERGSGFWAWKPFIIAAKLSEVPEGDLVFYCDIGRRFPYKTLGHRLDPFIHWMDQHGQDSLPGLAIPWRGSMSVWTKRDAFILTDTDAPEIHQLPPIQASFSLWRACQRTRDFLYEWTEWCSRRELISDDPSALGLPELQDFFEHRHDQALLTLCCYRSGLQALDMGTYAVSYDTRNPSDVLANVFAQPASPATLRIWLLKLITSILETLEAALRRLVKFGNPAKQHPLAD